MHLYYFSPKRLLEEEVPAKFAGGQFLMKTRLTKKDKKLLMSKGVSERSIQLILMTRVEKNESVVLRGGISRLEIPDMKRKLVVVRFSWLCERHFRFDASESLVSRWELIPPPAEQGRQEIDIDFISYWFPKRGKRLKMWTSVDEFCRFYKPGDPDNLAQSENDFIDPATVAEPAMQGAGSPVAAVNAERAVSA